MSKWNDYNLDIADDVLIKDFIELVKLIDNLDDYFKSNEQIIDLCVKIVDRLIKNDVVTFDVDSLDKKTRQILVECITKLVVGSVELFDAEMIWFNNINDGIINDNKGFYILNSQRISFGLIRTIDDRIREFIPFNNPFILDCKYDSLMPIDYDLSKLKKSELMRLHWECHDDARIHAIQTKEKPCQWIVKKHIYIIKEMKKRNIEHIEYCELDRISNDIKINNDVSLKGFIENFPVDEVLSYPLLSIQGNSVLSGIDSKIVINVNWPEYDTKFYDKLNAIVENSLPKYKDRVVFTPDKAGHKDYFLPIATLNINKVPSENMKVLNIDQGFFARERVKK